LKTDVKRFLMQLKIVIELFGLQC